MKLIAPLVSRNIANVGTEPPVKDNDCDVAGLARHCPVDGSVWHSEAVTGSVAVPVSTEAVIDRVMPMLLLATIEAPAPPLTRATP